MKKINFTNNEKINREGFTLSFHGRDVAVEHEVRTGLYVPDGILDNMYRNWGFFPASSKEVEEKEARIIKKLKTQAEELGLKVLSKTRKNGFSFWVELPEEWGFKMTDKGDMHNVSRYEALIPEGWELQ